MSDLSDAQFRISQDITGLSQQPAELNEWESQEQRCKAQGPDHICLRTDSLHTKPQLCLYHTIIKYFKAG